ncbi:MAG: hypothetical protein BAJATHORv1_20409 [Candidatus Thorarchaeota archaeon]|nr:MAG: hypothetical protein BAJATHORv1_20409 [Candidatus Thorarchaeota archaeon]
MQIDDLFFDYIFGFFHYTLYENLYPAVPLGPGDYFLIFTVILFVTAIFVVRRRAGGGTTVPEGVKRIIASTGDVSSGISGTKKVKFIKSPGQALVFLKIEENAIQQALTAVEYYVQQGDIDEVLKDKLMDLYQGRLGVVRSAIAKDEELKDIVDSASAVDRARSDYLRKLAAMSGTTVEADTEESGPSSVGMPSKVPATASPGASSGGGPPGGGAPSGGGPPGGGAPSGGGPPGGGAPSGGGPPGGGAPSGGGPPGGGAPSGGGPSGDGAPSGGGPPGGGAPSGGGPPGGGAPSGGGPSSTPGGTPSGGPKPSGGKSSLQSEMLAEMERLKALMSGD